MAAVPSETVCENALLVVLPLFEYIVTNSVPPIHTAQIDNRARKLQTFRANFLAEVQSLTRFLQNVVQSRARSPDTTSDEYIEHMEKALALFNGLISDEVPGRTFNCPLKLGDQEYLKLHALSQHILTDENGALPEFAHWILVSEREKKHDKILSKISKYNRRLSRLVEDPIASTSETTENDEEEPIPIYGAHPGLPETFGTRIIRSEPPYEVRQIIDKLYHVLVSSWSKNCTQSHKAVLRLATHRRRRDSTSIREEDADISRDFDLLFPTHSSPCQWKQTRISTVFSEGSKSHVKWAKRQTVMKRGFLKRAAPQPIESICAALDYSGTSVHVRAEDNEMWKLPSSSGPDYLPLSDENPTVSLKTIIEYAGCLTVRQKRIFAVILAYSLLYLSETPWLEQEWTKDDICFLQDVNYHIDVGRPYFAVDFADLTAGPKSRTESSDCDHIAPSILGFGILLIELEFGKPIESLWTSGDLKDGQKNPNTNKTAATRFLETGKEWDDYYYRRFQSAVSACISGKFLYSETITDDLSFQKAIYENVVTKLEEELYFGYTLRADTLDEFAYNPTFAYQSFHEHSGISVAVENKPDVSLFESLDPGTYHMDEENDFNYDRGNRVFDSTTMAVPASKVQPRKAHLAQTFFNRLIDVRNLLDSGRTADFVAVKVAIIDTGINENHPLTDKLGGYYDFTDSDFVQGETPPKDNTGHGSNMVYLLNKIAPYAHIYVARVFQRDSGDANTAMQVAKAIEHAKNTWGVDIISMSFGFKGEHPELVKVINNTNDVLMFAASSNFGATEDPPIRFPARVKHKVICVNSSDGLGHPSDLSTPDDPTRDNFSILGEDVPLGKKGEQGSEKMVYGTGTSIATPIAAGVAALVLEFARQEGVHRKVENIEALKTCIGMSAVLRRMTKMGKKNGFNFVAPEKVLLGDLNKGLSERMGAVCDMISDAIRTRYY